MYKIKLNKKCNIFIKDIGIFLSHFKNNWIFISNEDYLKSNDLKLIKNLLFIEKIDGSDLDDQLITLKGFISDKEPNDNIGSENDIWIEY